MDNIHRLSGQGKRSGNAFPAPEKLTPVTLTAKAPAEGVNAIR